MSEKKKKPIQAKFGRPVDDSFEAFVEFMDAMIDALSPGAERTMTEADKRKYHKIYLEKTKGKK